MITYLLEATDVGKFFADVWNTIVSWYENVDVFRYAVWIVAGIIALTLVFKLTAWLFKSPNK